MTDESPPTQCLPPVFLSTLDTTSGSALHILPKWFGELGLGVFTPVALYFLAISSTFVPLLVSARFSHLSLTIPSKDLALPFLLDFSTIFMYLISFPCLLMLVTTDNKTLINSLRRVQRDGIVNLTEEQGSGIINRWNHRFRVVNLIAQALGVVSGIVTGYFDFTLDADVNTHSWASSNGHVQPAGYVQLYCDFLFAVVAAVYLIRTIALIGLLWDIVTHAEVRMLPLHPDNAGGLQPIGRLGLRNQYAITLLGINIVVGYFVSHHFMQDWSGFIGAAVSAYLVFGPLVFVGPLLPFREGMIKNKVELVSGVALRMRMLLDDLRARSQYGAITEEDEKLIERLRKIGAVINDMPVWPFDAVTLQKFVIAYGLPILTFAIPKLVKYIEIPFLK